ncbi:hypothetical protein [Gordonia sihwensis]|uniref:hypothetical protein n=1 Tax=Gordonia sihwensis TaxID=173559 RepID=UPI003D960706
MRDVVHDFGDGTTVLRHEDLVMVVAGNACLAAFYPDDPTIMRRRYSLNLAELAVVGHRAFGGGILHLGGSGLSVARGLAGAGIGPHTVVEIDMAKTRWLVDKYPIDAELTLIDGDARHYADLVTTHPVAILDLTIGPLDPESAGLYVQLITELAERSHGECLILSNVHLHPKFMHGLVRTILAHPSPPLLWASESAVKGEEGSALLAWTADSDVMATLASLEWDTWSLIQHHHSPSPE